MKKLALLLAVSLSSFLVGCGDNKPATKPATTAPAPTEPAAKAPEGDAAKPAEPAKPADETK